MNINELEGQTCKLSKSDTAKGVFIGVAKRKIGNVVIEFWAPRQKGLPY